MGKFEQSNFRSGKLSPEQVVNMRNEYAAGATQGELARRYHLSVGQVGRIVRRESWNGIEGPPTREMEIAAENSLRRLAAGLAPAPTPDPDPNNGKETDEALPNDPFVTKNPYF